MSIRSHIIKFIEDSDEDSDEESDEESDESDVEIVNLEREGCVSRMWRSIGL